MLKLGNKYTFGFYNRMNQICFILVNMTLQECFNLLKIISQSDNKQ